MILVGQAPGPRTDPGEPLSGRCVNLLGAYPGRSGKGDAFPAGEARLAAAALDARGALVVLLGLGVTRAFKVAAPWFGRRGAFVVAPHPSGVSRWWNEAGNRRRARRFWRALARSAAARRAPRTLSPLS